MVKRKIRKARKAVLFVGEGHTEKTFLAYLKLIYNERGSGTNIKIESGDGGSPRSVIEKAIKLTQYTSYNETFVLIDDDLHCPITTLNKAKAKKISIFKTIPCIEGFFLEILKHKGFNPTTSNTDDCKKIFHKNYLPEKKKYDKNNYVKFFPDKLLEKQRKMVPLLDEIINIFEK